MKEQKMNVGENNEAMKQHPVRVQVSRRSLGGRGQQRGSALMLTIAIIAVVALVSGALVAYTSANYKVIQADALVRQDIYDGDGAIKAAINWAKTNPQTALDPEYFGGEVVDDCRYLVSDADGQVVTVSCEPPAGAESGVPHDQGLVPPAALLLTGTRHNEPGPYSFPECATGIQGFFNRIANYFKNAKPGSAEVSLKIAPANRANKWVTSSDTGGCFARTREVPNSTTNRLIINGRVVARGKIDFGGGTLQASDGIASKYGIVAGVVEEADDAETVDPGRKLTGDSDDFYSSINSSNDLNIKDEYLPVGFNRYGALKPGYSLPIRTTAYKFDPEAWSALGSSDPEKDPANLVPKNLVEADDCADFLPSEPIIFLPGRYLNAGLLNSFTANSADDACRGQTIWFAPDAFGPDAGLEPELLNPNSRTGAFLFDFVESPADLVEDPENALNTCGVESGTLDSRWCIGGSLNGDDNNDEGLQRATHPNVVVGWPDGWDPLPEHDPIVGTVLETRQVVLGPAASFEGAHKGVMSGLNYWKAQPGGNLKDQVAALDGSFATFEPCHTKVDLGIFNFNLVCPVLQPITQEDGRTAFLSGFSGVIGAPVEDGWNDTTKTYAYPKGRINVRVRWAYKIVDESRVDGAGLVFSTVHSGGNTEKVCLTVDLPKTGQKYEGSGEPASLGSQYDQSLTPAQAKTLADNCGTEAELRRLRVSFVGRGQNPGVFSGQSKVPSFYFDGVEISYVAPRGAAFPMPNNPAASSGDTEGLTARSDCDSKRPGGQLIFNGESNVYVADGALQVCGGPDPDDPSERLVIGIYGVPAVEPLKPVAFEHVGGYLFTDSQQNDLGLPANATWTAPGPEGKLLPGLRSDMGNSPGSSGGATPTSKDLQIGEPDGMKVLKVQVGCGDASKKGDDVFCPGGSPLMPWTWPFDSSGGFNDSRVKVTFEPYEAPPGYRIKKAAIRISYRDSGFTGQRHEWNNSHGFEKLDPPRKYCSEDAESNWIGKALSYIKAELAGCRDLGGPRSTGSAVYFGESDKPYLAPTQFQSVYQIANTFDGTGTESLTIYQHSDPDNSRLSAESIEDGVDITWATRVYCPDANRCQRRYVNLIILKDGGFGVYIDELDGVELDVEIEPDDSKPGPAGASAGPALLRPQSGCITAHPNYDEGRGMPDCAIVRADNFNSKNIGNVQAEICRYTQVWCDTIGDWMGRVSVDGTIYAPSAAMEVDATDVAYPLATRGVILRHLRLSGWSTRSRWAGDAISNQIDAEPVSRVADFVACRQEVARQGSEPCDASKGDVILTEARVRFEPPQGGATPSVATPSYPVVEYWASKRRAS